MKKLLKLEVAADTGLSGQKWKLKKKASILRDKSQAQMAGLMWTAHRAGHIRGDTKNK